MTGQIVLRIDGPPAGKGRPRFDARRRRTYTDDKTVSAEQRVQTAWMHAGRPRLPDGPITIDVEVAVARPQNHWRLNGSLSAAGVRAVWPIRKPDFDNAQKLLADALNGLAYRDDVDIVHARFVRRWANPGEGEHTIVRLEPAPTPDVQAVAA